MSQKVGLIISLTLSSCTLGQPREDGSPTAQHRDRWAHFPQLLVDDVASENKQIAVAAYDFMLTSPPGAFLPLLADAFARDPRFARQDLRRKVSELFVYANAAKFPQAIDGLLVGVVDDDVNVQGSCAIAISRGSTEVQGRALEVLAPIWRRHSELPPFRVVSSIRSAIHFGPSLDDYTDEFERMLMDQSVDLEIRGVAGGVLFHAGRIGRGLDLMEQLDMPGKTQLMKELKNVSAQRREFLNAAPNQAPRLRRVILDGLHSSEVDLRRAALKAFHVAFGEELLVKDKSGKWDLNREARAALEERVASESDGALVQVVRDLLDPNQTLGRLIKVAEEREQREKLTNVRHEESGE